MKSVNNLAEIALITKSLYDITGFRQSLANRIRNYSIMDPWFLEKFRDVEKQEGQWNRKLEKLLKSSGFGDILDIKGIGPRTVGVLVMNTIATERVYDNNGKYLHTTFKNKFKEFAGPASLWHYAGYHVVCSNCGLVVDKCTTKQTVSYMRGGKEYNFEGCGNYVGVGAKKRRGKPMDWNDTFRTGLLFISANMFRIKGPYRDIFVEARKKAIEAHPDWPKGRTFNHAKRIMIKQLLKDFYNGYLREGPCRT